MLPFIIKNMTKEHFSLNVKILSVTRKHNIDDDGWARVQKEESLLNNHNNAIEASLSLVRYGQ